MLFAMKVFMRRRVMRAHMSITSMSVAVAKFAVRAMRDVVCPAGVFQVVVPAVTLRMGGAMHCMTSAVS